MKFKSIILLGVAFLAAGCASTPRSEKISEAWYEPRGELVGEPSAIAPARAEDILPKPESLPEFTASSRMTIIEQESLDSPLPERSGEHLYCQAFAALDGGDQVKARMLLRKALWELDHDDPLRPSAAMGLARLYYFEGNYGSAIALLTRSGVKPAGVEAYFLADLYRAQADYSNAVDTYLGMVGGMDEIARDELHARIRRMIDRMGRATLSEFAASRPFTPEGGYATLRLSRWLMASGREVEAEPMLGRVAFIFSGSPMGESAEKLLVRQRGIRNVRPGNIGVLLPLSDRLAPFGKKVLHGILLGSRLFGADTSGHEQKQNQITLQIADSGGDPLKSAEAVIDLATRGVVGIIGPLKGEAAQAAAEAARMMGVPLVTVTPTGGFEGDGVFRLYLREEDEVDRLVAHAVETLDIRRFAILAPDNEAGRRYRKLFWDSVVEHGAEIAGASLFEASENITLETPIHKLTGIYGLKGAELRERFETERRAELEKQKSLLMALGIALGEAEAGLDDAEKEFAKYEPEPQVDFTGVFLPVSSLTAGQLAPQLPYYDVNDVVLLGIRSWNYSALTKVGKRYVRGSHFPVEWTVDSEEGAAFATAFEEAYGHAPGVLEAYGYDAVQLILDIAAELEVMGRTELQRGLEIVWAKPAVTGPLTTHPGGEIASEPKLMKVVGRKIVPATNGKEARQ